MIISLHHYDLAESVSEDQFVAAIRGAEEEDLFSLPGLRRYRFLRGIKGQRKGEYTSVWEYESRDAWRALWGPVGNPVSKPEYPARWNRWEDDVLDPLLSEAPDSIDYTSYEVVS